MSVGDVIRFERERLDLSRRELGDMINKSMGAIQSYELNISSPKSNQITDLCKALGVSPNDLLEWQGGDKYTTDNEIINEIQMLIARRRGK